MPGVLAVVTAADIDLPDLPPATPAMDQAMARPLLARDVVRFVGEPIVAIVTEQREQGPDAAEAVFVDYDPLPAVVDPEMSRDGGPKLFDDADSNVIWSIEARHRVADFSDCDVVVSQRMVNQRVAAVPHRGPHRHRVVGRRRAPHAVPELPGRPPGAHRDRRPLRPRPGRRAGGLPRRRRQLRRQGRSDPRAAAARRSGPAGRSPGPLVRDPLPRT